MTWLWANTINTPRTVDVLDSANLADWTLQQQQEIRQALVLAPRPPRSAFNIQGGYFIPASAAFPIPPPPWHHTTLVDRWGGRLAEPYQDVQRPGRRRPSHNMAYNHTHEEGPSKGTYGFRLMTKTLQFQAPCIPHSVAVIFLALAFHTKDP